MIHRQFPFSLCISKTRHFLSHRQLHSKPSHHHRHQNNIENDPKKQPKEGQFRYFKSMGQHILTNPRVLDSIIQKSDIRPTDTVLEIGPGTGNLTMKLLEASRRVVAVEVDKRMVEALNTRVAESGLEEKLMVICKDALKVDYPKFDLVVANIPYNISSPLIAKLLFGPNTFRSATLLLQKEFAQRLLANPGDSEFNRLAANVKLVADVEFIMNVSKRDFVPNPKVDSSVVKIWPKSEIPNVDLQEWWAFTLTCFCKKNKTLGATFKQKRKILELYRLSGFTGFSKEDGDKEEEDDDDDEGESFSSFSCSDTGVKNFREEIISILRSSGFEDKRPSKLCNEELLNLLSLFNEAGVCFHDRVKPNGANNAVFAAAYSP